MPRGCGQLKYLLSTLKLLKNPIFHLTELLTFQNPNLMMAHHFNEKLFLREQVKRLPNIPF